MVQGELVRPLAPALDQPRSDDFEPDVPLKESRHQRCLKCCGCIAAVLLIQVVVIIVLIFTVFQVKDPTIKMNRVTVTRLDLVNDSIPKPGVNRSSIADESVNDPNITSFKYSNTTTTLYYHGTVVGEAHGLPGRARPRRTIGMNITVDIIPEALMLSPNLSLGVLMSSYSRIKKHIIVKMRCTMVVNILTKATQE